MVQELDECALFLPIIFFRADTEMGVREEVGFPQSCTGQNSPLCCVASDVVD
jgi:hypothetical protein